MPSSKNHFMRLMQVEILDLIEDIEAVEASHKQSFEADTVSQYVYRENNALLAREIHSLQKIAKLIDGLDSSVYADTASLADDLLVRSKELVRKNEDPEAVCLILDRKIDKVLQYLSIGKEKPSGSA